MFDWLMAFTAHAMHVVSAGDPQDLSAVALVACLTELGIPFPLMLDSVLFLLGYGITGLWFRTVTVMLILLAARVLGATLVYRLSRSLGGPLVNSLGKRFPSLPRNVARLARKLGLKAPLVLALSRLGSQVPLTTSASSFGFRAPLTVVLARLTPGLLTATSVASGVMGLRYGYFALGIGMASILDDGVTIAIGAITGYGLRQLSGVPDSWLIFFGVVLDIAIVFTVQRLLWRRSKALPRTASPD